jgi:hypothetical protein
MIAIDEIAQIFGSKTRSLQQNLCLQIHNHLAPRPPMFTIRSPYDPPAHLVKAANLSVHLTR